MNTTKQKAIRFGCGAYHCGELCPCVRDTIADLLAMAKAYYQTLPDDGPEQDHYIRIIEKAEGVTR
jgi:hypothetical protein